MWDRKHLERNRGLQHSTFAEVLKRANASHEEHRESDNKVVEADSEKKPDENSDKGLAV